MKNIEERIRQIVAEEVKKHIEIVIDFGGSGDKMLEVEVMWGSEVIDCDRSYQGHD